YRGSQRYIDRLAQKKVALGNSVKELRQQRKRIQFLISDLKQNSERQVPTIHQIIKSNRAVLDKTDETDYNRLLGVGSEIATAVDVMLRRMDQHMQDYEEVS
ncbi:hypothetical protein RZS08_12355, partial [Arthrospira platensis SPKY1]|nr:hypothetical protein [Arthrospira platensis SPKY1]